jgi:hypothetical protein
VSRVSSGCESKLKRSNAANPQIRTRMRERLGSFGFDAKEVRNSATFGTSVVRFFLGWCACSLRNGRVSRCVAEKTATEMYRDSCIYLTLERDLSWNHLRCCVVLVRPDCHNVGLTSVVMHWLSFNCWVHPCMSPQHPWFYP